MTQLSQEAAAFMARFPRSDERTDFTRIADIRTETRAGFSPASMRAIERHQLVRDDIEVAGVPCERVASSVAGTASGRCLFVFGGAFIVGDPFSDLPIIGAIAEWCRVEVIAPKYRLAPEHPSPAAADDCFTVYAELADEPGPLIVAGESAGGNLALVTVQRAMLDGVRVPTAVAALSPAADLRPDRDLFGWSFDADPSLHPDRMLDVLDAYVGAVEPTDPGVSPAFGGFEGFPPTIITTGSRDLFMPMCLRLTRKMIRAGVDVTTRVWDGLWHVFEYYDQFPESAESLREIAAFLTDEINAAR